MDRQHVIPTIMAVITLFLTACSSGGDSGLECKTITDCGDGMVCFDGHCVPTDDVTDGDITNDGDTDGDVTDADITDGDVTDGDQTDGDTTDGDEDVIDEDDETTDEDTDTAIESFELSPEGGYFVTTDGVIIDVPAGAVDEDIIITVQPLPDPDLGELQPVSNVWRFGPSGLEFNIPAIITLPLDEIDDAAVYLIYWSVIGDDGNFELLDAISITDEGISAEIEHFSIGFIGIDVPVDGDLDTDDDIVDEDNDAVDGDTDADPEAQCDESPCCQNGIWLPSGTSCNDGEFCTVGETCNAAHSCQGGSERDCSQVVTDIQCQNPTCNETSDICEVSPKSNGTSCNDNMFCTVTDTCTDGACGGIERDCSVVLTEPQCQRGVCVEGDMLCRAENLGPGTSCDDGYFCTVGDTCDSGVCSGEARNCDEVVDEPQCQQGACNEAQSTCEALSVNEGDACNTGDICVANEICTAGACTGQEISCADTFTCTIDCCDEILGCLHDSTPCECDAERSCDDGRICSAENCDLELLQCDRIPRVEQYVTDDTFATPQSFPLQPDGSGEVDGVAVFPANGDFFELTVCSGGILTIDATFTHDLGDINLMLKDENGTTLEQANSETDNELIEWTSDIDGNVIIEVGLTGGAICNDYTLSVIFDSSNCVVVDGDEDEELEPEIEMEIEIETDGDEDIEPEIEIDLADVIINEIVYDQAGSESTLPPGFFVELYGPAGTNLVGYRLEGINGANGSRYLAIDLTGSIPPDGYYVVAANGTEGNLLSAADQLVPNLDYQNGPDSVQLLAGDTVLDTLGYGAGSAVYEDGSGPDASDGASVARYPNATDTDNNPEDFSICEFPTPGANNDECFAVDGDMDVEDEAEAEEDPIVIRPIKINEFVYDQAGSETDMPPEFFVELYGPAEASLNGYYLQAINGANGDVYLMLELSGNLGADGYYVIAEAGATGLVGATADVFVPDLDLQNGPDTLRLVAPFNLIDAVGYGVGAIGYEGSAPADEARDGASLARNPNGTDTNDNSSDFSVCDIPTPGSSNDPCFEQLDGDIDLEPELEPEIELEPEVELEPEIDLEPEIEIEPEIEVTPAVIAINEIVYDREGAESTLPPTFFIELYGPPQTDLAGYSLIGINGSDGAVYLTIPLSGTIGGDGFFVVAEDGSTGDLAAAADLLVSDLDFQNAPDSVQLKLGETIIDTLGYGFGAPEYEGEAAAPNATDGQSLIRFPDGYDTDDNADDFITCDLPTPGSTNGPCLLIDGDVDDEIATEIEIEPEIEIELELEIEIELEIEPEIELEVELEEEIDFPLDTPVINEIVYDREGSETTTPPMFFVELYGVAGTPLTGYALQGINGNGGAVYKTVPLSGSIGSDGYFVIAETGSDGSLAAAADLFVADLDFENGPDSVQLVFGAIPVDIVGYEAGAPVYEGSGPADGASDGASLARNPNGEDTNDNANDFSVCPLPTPGVANDICFVVDGDIELEIELELDDEIDIPPVQLPIINEVVYDREGAESTLPPMFFVEIYGPADTDLTGYSLVGINGSGGLDYLPVALNGTIPSDGYYVVAQTGSEGLLGAAADQLVADLDYQNGPDAIELRLGTVVVDALAYGNGAPNAEGSPADAATDGHSVARYPDATDTDDNATDFSECASPTPGGSNDICFLTIW